MWNKLSSWSEIVIITFFEHEKSGIPRRFRVKLIKLLERMSEIKHLLLSFLVLHITQGTLVAAKENLFQEIF